MDLKLFATKQHPLRASHLSSFLSCPWREVLLAFGDTDTAGEAADTGSATHAAVHTWHKTGDAAKAVEAMRARLSEYPQADMPVAAQLFLAYAGHPGNANVDIVLAEEELVLRLDPAPEDPTGEAVIVVGHPDQVRRVDGRLELWDLKTSKKMPHEVLWATQMQAAAYCKAAAAKLGEVVHPGGVIMPRRDPMHLPFIWTIGDVDRILAPLIHVVAMVRRGVVWHRSGGDDCRWCHTGGPDQCLSKLRYELPMTT